MELIDEEIDLIKIFRQYNIIVDKLEKFWVHSTQASIKNIDILKKAKQMKDSSITNSELKDIQTNEIHTKSQILFGF